MVTAVRPGESGNQLAQAPPVAKVFHLQRMPCGIDVADASHLVMEDYPFVVSEKVARFVLSDSR